MMLGTSGTKCPSSVTWSLLPSPEGLANHTKVTGRYPGPAQPRDVTFGVKQGLWQL